MSPSSKTPPHELRNRKTPKRPTRRDILNLLAQHRITAAEAASRLRGL